MRARTGGRTAVAVARCVAVRGGEGMPVQEDRPRGDRKRTRMRRWRRPRSSLGLATQAGDNISFNDPGRSIPFVWQYSAGFQYEVAPGTVIEATYSGSQTHALAVSRNINALSADQLALGTFYLNQGVPNPFYGVLPASTPRGTSSTVQRRVLLRSHHSGPLRSIPQ